MTLPKGERPMDPKEIKRIVEHEKIEPYYANCAMIMTSGWDTQLLFGRSIIGANNTVIETYEKVIYMSPPQAKAFLNALTGQIAAYEKNIGEIPMPPQVPQVKGLKEKNK